MGKHYISPILTAIQRFMRTSKIFAKPIEAYVKKQQYKKETFELEVFPQRNSLKISSQRNHRLFWKYWRVWWTTSTF